VPRIVKTLEAENDLVSHFVFIGRQSVRNADRFLRAADQACQTLATMPSLGSPCDSSRPALAGLRIWSIRKFPKYLIVYRPLADGIEVVRVLHGRRDIESLF
jgi:toxin ParE1/3/4